MTGARIHPDFRSAVERALVDEVGGRLTDIYLPDDRRLTDLWAIGRTPDDNIPGSRFREVARNVRIEGRRTVYVAADGTRTALPVPRDGVTPHHEPLAPRSHATVVWSQFPMADTRVYVPASGVFDLGGMADLVVVANSVVYRVTIDVGPRALKRFVPDVSQGFRASPVS
ncbi:hypothetical protein [Glycomyces sp. NRRL B-16210]|uniref:hypothetical protein n=1 Tax=Glycomyces sp. NRRL B-16210 TaxID=1463821 RepID=UPI0004C241A4|nr:hypothetical protein [Glycomyces sp. NRRL B-16210]